MLKKAYLEEKRLLVAEKLLHFGAGAYESDKQRSKELCYQGHVERDFGIMEWDWPQGVGLYQLSKMAEQTQDAKFDAFLEHWFEGHFRAGLPSRNVNTTMPFLTLLSYAVRHNRKDYLDICLQHACWLVEKLPRTKEDGFQHVTSAIGDRNGLILNEQQLWVDTIFMACLFLSRAGIVLEREEFVQESIYQILLHIKYLFEKKTSLLYHGWSFARNDNFADVFWCRGNSWFTLGVLEFLSQCGQQLGHAEGRLMEATYRAQVDALSKLQRQSGLWTTVLDDASSYEEVSGSAGIAAGIFKGISMGILDRSYCEVAEKAVLEICENISAEGVVEKVSAGTAIGMSAQFYQEILVRPMAYGQSLVLAALNEAILFSQ